MDEARSQASRRIEVLALACEASLAINLATGLAIVRIVAVETIGSPLLAAGAEEAASRGEGQTGGAGGGWAPMPFDWVGVGSWPVKIEVRNGRLLLDVPIRVAVGEYEEALHEALSRYRLRFVDDAVLVDRRSGVAVFKLPASVPGLRAKTALLGGHPLFSIDPTSRLPQVARAALAARRAAIKTMRGKSK